MKQLLTLALTFFVIASFAQMPSGDTSPNKKNTLHDAQTNNAILEFGTNKETSYLPVKNVNHQERALKTVAALPVHLQGSLDKNKARLSWSVTENEATKYFEIHKSTDGKKFTSIALFFCSENKGIENYTFKDAKTFKRKAYYTIRSIHNNGTTSQSNVVVLKVKKSG
jgi:hypothetical protein